MSQKWQICNCEDNKSLKYDVHKKGFLDFKNDGN